MAAPISIEKFLVISSKADGTLITVRDVKPRETTLVVVFPITEITLDSFLVYVKITQRALDPQNRYFVDNVRTLDREFPLATRDWLSEYIAVIFPKDGNISSSRVRLWLDTLTAYTRRYPLIPGPSELLTGLMRYYKALHESELSKTDAKQAEDDLKKLNERGPAPGATVTSALEIPQSLVAQIAKKLGKEYNAHIMLDSKRNENKQRLFNIHEGVYEWLKSVSLKDTLPASENASSVTLAMIRLTLKNQNLPLPNIVGLSTPELASLVREGRLGLSDVPIKQREKVTQLVAGVTVSRESFYQSLQRTVTAILAKCGLLFTWEDEPVTFLSGEAELLLKESRANAKPSKRQSAEEEEKELIKRLISLADELVLILATTADINLNAVIASYFHDNVASFVMNELEEIEKKKRVILSLEENLVLLSDTIQEQVITSSDQLKTFKEVFTSKVAPLLFKESEEERKAIPTVEELDSQTKELAESFSSFYTRELAPASVATFFVEKLRPLLIKEEERKDRFNHVSKNWDQILTTLATQTRRLVNRTSPVGIARATMILRKLLLSKLPLVLTSAPELDSFLQSQISAQADKEKRILADKLSQTLRECFLTRADYLASRDMEEALVRSRRGTELRLYPWQERLVTAILAGESVIAVGPTSGGKTLASMVALDGLFRNNKDKDVSLVYVAPNFYQAFQAYTNMVETFSDQVFGLITGNINFAPPNCKYWVGTPEQLWVYARSSNKTFNIGIIDEIHTISLPQDGNDKVALRKATSLAKIVSLITTQFIGLSATIHPEDEVRLRDFVQGILDKARSSLEFVRDALKNKETLEVKYGMGDKKLKRPIPLVEKIFTGDAIRELKMEAKESTALPKKTVRVTPENTFNLLKLLQKEDMTPALIFDLDEKASYTFFGQLVKYLHARHDREYLNWREVAEKFNPEIENFNKEISKVSADEATIESLKGRRAGLLRRITEYLNRKVKALLGLQASTTEETKNEARPVSSRPRRSKMLLPSERARLAGKSEATPLVKTSKQEGVMVKVEKSFLESLAIALAVPLASLPTEIAQETLDLIEQWKFFRDESSRQTFTVLPEVCSGIGTYFRFGPPGKKEVFRQALDKNRQAEQGRKQTDYNIMTSLIEAEGVRASDVEEIFNLMDMALSFGIGILLPSMPFCVQYMILTLLDRSEIPIVFASESMSMGVNFPTKTCVVRANTHQVADVGRVLQMQGRAGRSGHSKDKVGYSVSWNIANATDMVVENTPRLNLDLKQINLNHPGTLTHSHKELAIKINTVRNTSEHLRAMQTAVNSLRKVQAKVATKATLHQDREINLKEYSGRSFREDKPLLEEDEGKSKKLQVKEEVSNNPAVMLAITRCVSLIGEDLLMSAEEIDVLNFRVTQVFSGTERPEILEDPYVWAEKLNTIKLVLQEIHTVFRQRACVDLLDYLATMHAFIHRICMRYIGLVYQKESEKSSK